MRTLHPLPVTNETRAHLAQALNRNLHEVMMMEWQLKQAHWNTRGAWFFARHQLFDDIGLNLRGAADMLAERVGALGFAAEMRPDRITADALPPLSPGLCHGETFLEELARNMVRLSASLRDSLYQAEKLGDPITADLVTEITRTVEKDSWFIRSHLEGPDPMTVDVAMPMQPRQGKGEAKAPSSSRPEARPEAPSQVKEKVPMVGAS